MANVGKSESASKQKRESSGGQDAISLLTKDHNNVKELLKNFEQLRKEKAVANRRREIALQICNELKVHTQIEEEIFYPGVREFLEDQSMIDEALVEHQSAKSMIKQIESMDAGDELYDASVTVLGEYVKHHINEEERELFPEVKSSDADTIALGEELMERKEELMNKLH